MISTAESQTYVREATNNNDHKQINVYFRAIGWKSPEKLPGRAKPYCGAFVGWVLIQCDLVSGAVRKINMASVASWNTLKPFFLKAGQMPLPGDIVTYRTWSHVEFNKYWPLDPRIRIFRAVGGNTGSPNQGVHTDLVRPKNIVRNQIRLFKE
ncbi:hypothetical protein BLX24_03660 [Arsenicibacter rosenii]|uniref:Peptidase C51 domain-containing protein n=1 Tax=Arsenicibacter rosenii TaxID=1750698 RepID=A0A1S2VSL4_9BACT|nr:hypothetical protein BLX24_03660 [Arsenicibacter rosenii]